jgi:hypothetical protein
MVAAIRRASSFDLNQCGPITKHLQVMEVEQESGAGIDHGYSGHGEGGFVLGANSTAGRPCCRRLRISGKIYLVVPPAASRY